MYKKIESVIQVLLAILWFFGCQFLVLKGFQVLIGNDPLTFEGYYNKHMYLMNFSVQLICLLGIIVGHKIFKKDIKVYYRNFNKIKVFKYIGYGLILWLLAGVLNGLIIRFFPDYNAQITSMFLNKEMLLRFMVLVIFAPILEELLFRGVILGSLKKGFDVPLAIILQGILFGGIHSLPLQKIYASVLGIGLGIVREKEDNLQSSTIMHMTINLIGFIIGMTLSVAK